jgi:hypothetical protein
MQASFTERLSALLHNRPVVLLGEVSLSGRSLEQCAKGIEPMLDAGLLLRLTPDECKAKGWRGDSIAFRLPSPP